jgi:PAS domain S-box-containing protein
LQKEEAVYMEIKTEGMRWKIILVIMSILMAVCFIFSFQLKHFAEENLAEKVSAKEEIVTSLTNILLRQTKEQYQSRIKNLINYKTVQSKELILQAFDRRDREELFRLTQSFLQSFKRENQYFDSFTWILPNNKVFLRVHNPQVFGDDITTFCPDVAVVNKEQKQVTGFASGWRGIQFRVVTPVFYKGKYLGALQFGIGTDFLVDTLQQELKMPVALAVLKRECAKEKNTDKEMLSCGKYVIRANDVSLYEEARITLDFSQDRQRVLLQGKEHILLNTLWLNSFQGRSLAKLFVSLDISEEIAQKHSMLAAVLILVVLVCLLSFLVLFFGIGSVLEEIVCLNQELESRVVERTAQLEKSKQRYSSMFMDNHSIMLLVNAGSGAIINANPAACVFYGYDRETMVRMHIQDLNTLSEEEVAREIKKVEKGEKQYFNFKHRLQNGDVRDVEMHSCQLAGQEQGVLFSIVHDVTNRKLVEKQLQMFKSFAESSTQGLGWVDMSGDIVYVNPALATLLEEKNITTPLGKNVITSYYPIAEQERLSKQIFPHLLETGTWNGDLELQTLTGKIIPTYNELFVIYDDASQPLFFANFVSNISLWKKEEELRRLESLKTMAGAIAHRFNNSMMTVQGNLDMLARMLPDKSDEHDMILNAVQSAKGASQIGSMMLSYVGQRQANLQECSLEKLFKESIVSLKDFFPASIALQVVSSEQSLYCLADQAQIKEVVETILLNSVESIGSESGVIEITFGIDFFQKTSFPVVFQGAELRDGEYVYCQISDSGHGISQENLSRIFEPFYSTRFVGRGLGLALTVGIMQSHHGALLVGSQTDMGTTVRLLLPVVASSKRI